jgi:hypothetical protein
MGLKLIRILVRPTVLPEQLLANSRNYVMTSPRNLPVPRFAPEGSITLISALDLFGRGVDSSWTGLEIQADIGPEPSDEELDHQTLVRLMRESSDNPLGETGKENRSEDEIRASLYEQRATAFAARRRWQAAAIEFMRCLHRGVLQPYAMGSDGKRYEVFPNIWAADGADELFDIGGLLLVRGNEVIVRRGLTPSTETAIILIRDRDIREIAHRLEGGELPVELLLASDGPNQSDLPGQRPRTTANAALFWKVALEILEGPNKPNRGRGRLTALARLVSCDSRAKGLKYQQNSIEKIIRGGFQDWERLNPDK